MYWLPHDTAKTDGGNRRSQPSRYSRVPIPYDLRPFPHFSPNGGHSLAVDAFWNIKHAAFRMDRLKLMVWAVTTVRLKWQHNSFDITFGRTSSTTRLVYQRLKGSFSFVLENYNTLKYHVLFTTMTKCCSSGRPADLWLCMWKYDGQIQVSLATWVKVSISVVLQISDCACENMMVKFRSAWPRELRSTFL